MDGLQYTVKPNVKRTVVTKFLGVLVLSFLFYFIIKLNMGLANLDPPSSVNILIILILVVLMLLQVFLSYSRVQKESYQFYLDRIVHLAKKEEVVMLNEVQQQQVNLTRNIFDKMFGTAAVVVTPKFKITGIENADQIVAYVKRLVQSMRAYNGAAAQQAYQSQANGQQTRQVQ